jgi:hypothetical protein
LESLDSELAMPQILVNFGWTVDVVEEQMRSERLKKSQTEETNFVG